MGHPPLVSIGLAFEGGSPPGTFHLPTTARDAPAASVGDGLEDDLGGDVGLGDERDVGAHHLLGDCLRPLRHEAFGVGGMALSCADTMYHVGRAFQPATVAFSVRAARLSGR